MDFWFLALLTLFGLALTFVFRRLHWALSFGLALVLLAYGAGGDALVQQLSPEAFAKLPVSGTTLGYTATWSLFIGIGAAIGVILRGGLALVSRKPTSPASTEKAPE